MSPSTVLTVRVTPRAGPTPLKELRRDLAVALRATAGRSAVGRGSDSAPRTSPVLLVKLAAAPVDGAANDELVAMLARALDLPKRAIRIVGGERSRTKRVAVDCSYILPV